MPVKIKLYFRFAGFKENPNVLSNLFNLKPDVVHIKDEPVLPKIDTIKRKYNVWEIHSNLSEDKTFELHLKNLIKKLIPSYTVLKEFSLKSKPRLNCVIEMYNNDKPSIYISDKNLKFFSDLSTDIEFDMYNYG